MNIVLNEGVVRIATTGGPGGGKTTVKLVLQQWLSERGFVTVVVPEAATEFIGAGLPPWANWDDPLVFQEVLLRHALHREDLMAEAALHIPSDRPRILLCDRGVLDAAAYVSPEQFREVLRRVGYDRITLSDRYIGVIHLVTAAEGALSSYTLANNAARTETPEQAIALDYRTREAWLGHPHLRVIGNETDFAGKINRVKQALARLLGIPVPIEDERKFLVGSYEHLPTPFAVVEITQTYLLAPEGEERRIRERRQGQGSTWYYTVKGRRHAGGRSEQERQVSAREASLLLGQALPGHHPVTKHRHCFLHEEQYFELDVFAGRLAGLVVLEIELCEGNEQVLVPPFLNIKREVTDDESFSNFELSTLSTAPA
jgi:CYTH domain-containing protein/predicted ATPase